MKLAVSEARLGEMEVHVQIMSFDQKGVAVDLHGQLRSCTHPMSIQMR